MCIINRKIQSFILFTIFTNCLASKVLIFEDLFTDEIKNEIKSQKVGALFTNHYLPKNIEEIEYSDRAVSIAEYLLKQKKASNSDDKTLAVQCLLYAEKFYNPKSISKLFNIAEKAYTGLSNEICTGINEKFKSLNKDISELIYIYRQLSNQNEEVISKKISDNKSFELIKNIHCFVKYNLFANGKTKPTSKMPSLSYKDFPHDDDNAKDSESLSLIPLTVNMNKKEV